MTVRYAVAALGALALTGAAGVAAANAAPAASPHGSAVVTLRILPGPRPAVESVVPEPNFAIAPGVGVTLRIVNCTREWHTFTVPGLGVGAMIRPRQGAAPRITWVRFTAWKSGVFDWYCVLCRVGLHRHPHEMGGKVYAIVGASA